MWKSRHFGALWNLRVNIAAPTFRVVKSTWFCERSWWREKKRVASEGHELYTTSRSVAPMFAAVVVFFGKCLRKRCPRFVCSGGVSWGSHQNVWYSFIAFLSVFMALVGYTIQPQVCYWSGGVSQYSHSLSVPDWGQNFYRGTGLPR
jgi:hypothetical protein